MALGSETISLAFALHPYFCLFMNLSQTLFFEVWHRWGCFSTLDLSIINKILYTCITCFNLVWFGLYLYFIACPNRACYYKLCVCVTSVCFEAL